MPDWFWWPRFHDPALRLTPGAQVRVHWDANVRMLRDWRACWEFTWISILPVPLLVAAILCLGTAYAFPTAPSAPDAWLLAAVILSLAYLLLQHVAFMVAMRRTYVPFVRHALAARGNPVCLSCGHLLDPGRAETCPECGRGTQCGNARNG